MKVRAAEPDDLDVLVGFIAEEAREAGEHGKNPATIECGIRAGLENPSVARYWVLEDGSGVPCGSVSVTREWSDWNAFYYWWIQSIYICPEQRGQYPD